MCGIGLIKSRNGSLIPGVFANGLEHYIKHRGQDNTGICSKSGDYFYVHKAKNLTSEGVPSNFKFGDLLSFGVRYATVGVDMPFNYTPSAFKKRKNIDDLSAKIKANNSVVVFLNGEARTEWVDDFLNRKHKFAKYKFKATNDTARLAGLIQYLTDEEGFDLLTSVKYVMAIVPGAYAMTVMKGDETVIGRGKHGTRPLNLYINDDYLMLSSETQAFKLLDERYHFKKMELDEDGSYSFNNGWRSVHTGELLLIKGDKIISDTVGLSSEKINSPQYIDAYHCIFELIYFAHASGYMSGFSADLSSVVNVPINKIRGRWGKYLNKIKPVVENPSENLIIGPVPNSARPGADAYAGVNNYKHREALIPALKIRTFISPGQKNREQLALKKFIPNSYVFVREEELERVRALGINLDDLSLEQRIKVLSLVGNEIVLIDDSLVRGTTSKRILATALVNGATKVHLKLCSPEIFNPCWYGIAMNSNSDFYALGKTKEQLLDSLIADVNELLINDPTVPSYIRASRDNIAIEYMELDNLVKGANSFFVENYLRRNFPQIIEPKIRRLSEGIMGLLTFDNLIKFEGLTEAKSLVVDYLHKEFEEILTNFDKYSHQAFAKLFGEQITEFDKNLISNKTFTSVFEEAVKQRWCLSCFTGEYHTCTGGCEDCTSCSDNFDLLPVPVLEMAQAVEA